MSASEINVYLGILCIVTGIGFLMIYQACIILSKNNYKLRQDIKEKDKMIYLLTKEVQSSIDTYNAIADRKEFLLSDKTQKLLNLAVSKENEYESITAAKEVCRRLSTKRF